MSLTLPQKLERCGFCGLFFRGNGYILAEELKSIPKEELSKAPLGYCPNAQEEDYQQNPEKCNHQVTRDMAMDACDPSLEGQWI